MACTATCCARTIAAVVSAEPGVKKATVSFKTQEARILFDPVAVSEDRLDTAIEQAGYSTYFWISRRRTAHERYLD